MSNWMHAGAFLIPYIIMAIVEGLPIFYLELLIGQSVRRGAVGVWRILNPRMSGIGYASAVVCAVLCFLSFIRYRSTIQCVDTSDTDWTG